MHWNGFELSLFGSFLGRHLKDVICETDTTVFSKISVSLESTVKHLCSFWHVFMCFLLRVSDQVKETLIIAKLFSSFPGSLLLYKDANHTLGPHLAVSWCKQEEHCLAGQTGEAIVSRAGAGLLQNVFPSCWNWILCFQSFPIPMSCLTHWAVFYTS